jgi:imidazolonepropionase-like amidohydrolase
MRGARQIKIFVTGGASDRHTKSTESYYSREEIEAGIDEAHRAGRRVSLHLNGGIAAPWAIKSGADTLEHGGALTADDFDLMLKNGTWLGATPVNVSIEEGMTREQREDPIISEKIKQAREAIRRVYPMAIQAAIPYVIGTDGLHGLLPRGVEFMVEFGASPMEAILAVTSRAAQLAGLEHVIGTVEPGKYADIISVAGNPLEDISSLQRVHLIMKEGRRYDDGALGQLGTQRVDEVAQRLPTPGL